MMERAKKREGIEQQKNMSNEDMRGDDLFALVRPSVCWEMSFCRRRHRA